MEWGTLRHLYINLSIMSQVHCDKLEKLAQAQVAKRLWQGFCEQGGQSVMIQTRKRLARAKYPLGEKCRGHKPGMTRQLLCRSLTRFYNHPGVIAMRCWWTARTKGHMVRGHRVAL